MQVLFSLGHVLCWCYLVVVMYMQREGLSLRHVQSVNVDVCLRKCVACCVLTQGVCSAVSTKVRVTVTMACMVRAEKFNLCCW